MRIAPSILYFFMILLFAGSAIGGTKGKIAGKVTDLHDGTPLIGANVYIEQEQLGAVTDKDGYFYIINIRPGTHTVTASMIGYKTVNVQGVDAVSDQTTALNIVMETSVLEGEEVVITAERPLVQADLTATKSTITEAELKSLPTESYAALLSTKAGVTVGSGGALHVRGGRSSEVLYLVDGIPATNPFSNGVGISISTNMISELTLISGTFNAEYGKAMSGVVNLITREGGAHFSGNVRFQTGDMYSGNTDIFKDANEFDALNFQRLDLGLNGPIPFLSTGSFLVSASLNRSGGWLYGWREHQTYDMFLFTMDSTFIMNSGDSSRIAMNPNRSANIMTKLSFRPSAASKLIYQFTRRDGWSRSYDHTWKFNPDGRYQYQSGNLMHALHFSQTLSTSTYFTIKLARREAYSEQYVHKLEMPYSLDERDYGRDLNRDGKLGIVSVDWDFLRDYGAYLPNPIWYTFEGENGEISVPRYVPLNAPSANRSGSPANHFVYGGQRTGYYLSDYTTTTLKLDLTSQVNKHHQIRAGYESNWYRLHSNSMVIEMSGRTDWQPYVPPISTASHGHDEYVRKPIDFAVYLQDKIEFETLIVQLGLRYDYFNANDDVFTNKITLGDMQAATPKSQVSPRVGASFPITDQGYIHFSYGHFFQMPGFSYLYRNPDLKHPAGSLEQFGNPDLEPQRTVMYELGLQQQLHYTTAVDATFFYRNIQNWLSTEYNFIDNIFRYTRYITESYGNVRGLTVALVQRPVSGVAINLDYTLELAEGNASSPDEAYFDNLADPPIESEKRVVPLDWDVRHTANATVSYRTANQSGISFITKFSSGLPYTPTIQGLRWSDENSGRKPLHLTTDLQAYKNLHLFRQQLIILVKIYNLFDRLNERYVFTDTGRSNYALTPKYTADPVDHYPDLKGVHHLKEYIYSPTNYRTPRQILVSLEYSF